EALNKKELVVVIVLNLRRDGELKWIWYKLGSMFTLGFFLGIKRKLNQIQLILIVAGTARTSLIVTIGPSPSHRGETSSTIMFGQR
ncbi:hypothetical protein MKW92_041118, partial [Papaver armeniacum]